MPEERNPGADGPQRLGVDDVANLIDEGTAQSPAGYPACAADTSGSCYVVSVLKYLQFGWRWAALWQ